MNDKAINSISNLTTLKILFNFYIQPPIPCFHAMERNVAKHVKYLVIKMWENAMIKDIVFHSHGLDYLVVS